MADLFSPSTLRGDQRISTIQGPQGPPGTPGSVTTSGTTIPSALAGQDGDVYLQKDTNNILVLAYQKLAGIWTTIGEINAGWVTYTPAITSETGTLTTASTSARYKKLGKTVYIKIVGSITTNGTGAGAIYLGLPFTSDATLTVIPGIRNNGLGAYRSLFGYVLSTVVAVYNYDGTYPGADGVLVSVSGYYETA